MHYIRFTFFLIFLSLTSACLAYGSPPKKVYISMTTSPTRLKSIHVLLKKLQEWIVSDEVSKVYIHIPEKYRNDEQNLYDPRRLGWLKELFSRSSRSSEHPGYDGKVEFNQIEFDYGPITKIAPVKSKLLSGQGDPSSVSSASPARSDEDAIVISIDDDYLYPPEYLKFLVDQLKERSITETVSALAYKTGKVELWGIQKSASSQVVAGQKFPSVMSSVDMIEGWGGIAYRLEDLDSELMFRLSQRSLECRLSDDLVISFVMGINRKRKKTARYPSQGALAAATAGVGAEGRGERDLFGGVGGSLLVPLTDVGALSAGSGLENWFHAGAWDDFKRYILDNGGRSGQVSQLKISGGAQAFPEDDDLDEEDLGSAIEALSTSTTSFSVLPFSSMGSRKHLFDPAHDVLGTDRGDFVKIFGRSKIGFIGQKFAVDLISELEAQGAIERQALETEGLESQSKIEQMLYRNLFNRFVERSELKIDGFKYTRCLRSLNACAYSGGPKPKLKSRDQILRDCGPEERELSTVSSGSEESRAVQGSSAENVLNDDEGAEL